MAEVDAAKQATWLRQLLGDLRINIDEPITIYGDNQGAIAMTENPGQHDRSKHIGIRGNYVREEVAKGNVKFRYTPTADNTADIMTKAVDREKVEKFSQEMGMSRKHLETRDVAEEAPIDGSKPDSGSRGDVK